MKKLTTTILALVAAFSLIVLLGEKAPEATWQQFIFWKIEALLCLILSSHLIILRQHKEK